MGAIAACASEVPVVDGTVMDDALEALDAGADKAVESVWLMSISCCN